MFPPHLATSAPVLLDLLKLAHRVAAEGLKDHLRKKALTHRQKLFSERGNLLHERGVKAFQDVRIRLEGHHEKLLQFPHDPLPCAVLKLVGRAEEGPLQFCRSQIDTAQIGIRIIGLKTVSPRTGYAAVDHKLIEIEF